MRYRYGQQRQHTHAHINVITTILLLGIAVAGYFSFDLYMKNLELKFDVSQKAQTISEKNQTITDLEKTLQDRDRFILNLNEDLSELESILQDTEIELESLKPVVKRYYAAAVRSDGTGTVIPVELKLSSGDGSISVNIKNVDLLAGTQASLRTAADVAEDKTGIDISQKDITITFINEFDETLILDGPSAGGVLATLIIAGLQDRTIDTSVLATGTIESDGRIGAVDEVAGKAQAAKNFGADKFLVPDGQSVSVNNLEVIEVSNIDEMIGIVLGD